MRCSVRRLASGVAGAVLLVVPASLAWACVGVVSLTTSPNSVQPGGTVTATGKEFAAKIPVEIHLDSATGPVLATAPPTESTMSGKFTVDVPIPADVSPGQHVLVATQQYHDMNSGSPARSVVYVGSAAPAPPEPPARPVGLEVGSGPSAGSLVLIAAVAAIAGLVLAGLGGALLARRGGSTESAVAQ